MKDRPRHLKLYKINQKGSGPFLPGFRPVRVSGFIFFLFVFLISSPGLADDDRHQMKRTLRRGAVNILTAPLEIPVTVQAYHEQAGWPVARHLVGLAVGTGQMFVRLGSGLLDLPCALVPRLQKGFPVQPETLF